MAIEGGTRSRRSNCEVPLLQDVDMPRRTGLEKSTLFHVWNRGADRQDIFLVNGDHESFERLLEDVVAETGASIHAYALMTNHYHLLVEAPTGQLSRAMYLIDRAYAVRGNRLGGRSGPFFDNRFGSEPITSPEMLMIEGRYVHRNPADVVGLRGLANYRFSSLGVYSGHRQAPSWLSTERLSEPFADGVSHLEFVRRTHPSDTQYAGQRPPLRTLDVDELDSVVCAVSVVEPVELCCGRRGVRNDARVVAVTLATELRLANASVLAARYGFGSAQSLRNAASKGRTLRTRDASFAHLHERVLCGLAAA